MLIGAIVGATGVGKTEIAVSFAEMIGAEIINMDSRQIYRGMSIGTAQPAAEDLRRVPHHLVGFLDPDQSYSAARFLSDVRAIENNNPHKRFLLVGGTGFYLQVVQHGLSPMPEADLSLRGRLEGILREKGLDFMVRWVKRLDPRAVVLIDCKNPRRVLRVLEVCLQTRRPWSSWIEERQDGLGFFPVVWLDRERPVLHQRIAKRTERMLENGWVREAQELARRYPLYIPGMQSIGYAQLAQLSEEHVPESVKFSVIAATRQYAKRQITWFRQHCSRDRLMLTGAGNGENLKILQEIKKKFFSP